MSDKPMQIDDYRLTEQYQIDQAEIQRLRRLLRENGMILDEYIDYALWIKSYHLEVHNAAVEHTGAAHV